MGKERRYFCPFFSSKVHHPCLSSKSIPYLSSTTQRSIIQSELFTFSITYHLSQALIIASLLSKGLTSKHTHKHIHTHTSIQAQAQYKYDCVVNLPNIWFWSLKKIFICSYPNVLVCGCQANCFLLEI